MAKQVAQHLCSSRIRVGYSGQYARTQCAVRSVVKLGFPHNAARLLLAPEEAADANLEVFPDAWGPAVA